MVCSPGTDGENCRFFISPKHSDDYDDDYVDDCDDDNKFCSAMVGGVVLASQYS